MTTKITEAKNSGDGLKNLRSDVASPIPQRDVASPIPQRMEEPSGNNYVSTPHYVRSFGLGVIAVLIGLELSGWIGFVLTDLHNHSDFPMYYRAGMLIRTGHCSELYAPHEIPYGYTHPAFEALLFVPFTLLPFGWAYIAWSAVNISTVIATARLLSNSALKQVSPAGALGILLAFVPISFSVMNGQDSVLVLFLSALSFRELSAGNTLRSGVLLGLTVFRFQFLVPCLVMLAIWKLSEVAKAALLSSTVLMILSVIMTGLRAQATYFHLIHDLGRNSSAAATHFATMATLRTFLVHINLGRMFIPLCILFVASTIWIARNNAVCDKFILAVTLACIVNSYLYVYDLCVLTLPLIVFASSLVERRLDRDLLLPLALIAFPMVVLMTLGAKWLWLCGLLAPLLLCHMLIVWNLSRKKLQVCATNEKRR